MRSSRLVLMILTGAVLAFVIWLVIIGLAREDNLSENQAPVETTTNAVLEDFTISPASVQSSREQGDVVIIQGMGRPGAHIELIDKTRVLTQTDVNDAGEWRIDLPLTKVLARQVAQIFMTVPSGERVRSDQVIVIIKDISSEGAKRRVLVYLTAPGAQSSILQTPYSGFPGKDGFYLDAIDYDNSGGVIFSGTSVKRGKVRILASDTLVGESSVDARGRWSLIFGNIMPLGAYEISAELLPNNGTDLVRIDLPFERMAPLFQAEGSPDIKVEYLTDRIQVARAVLGGGYQYTVLYAPIAVAE